MNGGNFYPVLELHTEGLTGNQQRSHQGLIVNLSVGWMPIATDNRLTQTRLAIVDRSSVQPIAPLLIGITWG